MSEVVDPGMDLQIVHGPPVLLHRHPHTRIAHQHVQPTGHETCHLLEEETKLVMKFKLWHGFKHIEKRNRILSKYGI